MGTLFGDGTKLETKIGGWDTLGMFPSVLETALGAILARVFRVVFEGTFGITGSLVLFSGSFGSGFAGAELCVEDQADSGGTDSPCLMSMVIPRNSASW